MSKIKGQQTIECSVNSCKYHNQNHYCNLQAIKVTPCGHVNNGIPEDETLCSSFEKDR